MTTNFRLGVFSSFAHPTLADAGAFAIEDQQAALRWVRRNATAFCGDPSRVTLVGESGGAYDVCGQLTSPGSRGLFHRAIIQSGSCSSSWPVNGVVHGEPAGRPWQSMKQARANGVTLAEKFGCHDPATAVVCLRAVPTADLTAEKFITTLTPITYGTRALPVSPYQALAQGRFHRLPVITGHQDLGVGLRVRRPAGPNGLVRVPGINLTPTQRQLANQMIRYWSHFAATGNPNSGDLPAWSRFKGNNVQSLAPTDSGGTQEVNLAREHDCGFWGAVTQQPTGR